jgi:uncharacterized protein (DUF4415 family)
MRTKKNIGARGSRKSRNPDDAPRLDRAWFAEADLYVGKKLVNKGGRPKSLAPKVAINIRLSPDVLAHFRASGKGWQTRIDGALRKAVGL